MAMTTIWLWLLKVTIAMVLGLLVLRLGARQAAAVRHWILVTTLTALVMIPVAVVVLPPWGVRIAQDAAPIMPILVRAGLESGPVAAAREFPAKTGVDFSTILSAGWTIGAGLCLLPPLAALIQSRRLRREGRPWRGALPTPPQPTGWLASRARVLLHDRLSGPMTCGVLNPVILLPGDATGWTRQDRQRALVYELARRCARARSGEVRVRHLLVPSARMGVLAGAQARGGARV